MLSETELRERVQRGMAFLDVDKPGWEDCIDLERLDMSNCGDCVLGQIYGYYGNGLGALYTKSTAINPLPAILHAFTRDNGNTDWRDLKSIWIDEITKRRNAKAAV